MCAHLSPFFFLVVPFVSVLTFTAHFPTRTKTGDPFMEVSEGKKISRKKLLTFLLFSFTFGLCLLVYLHQFWTSESDHYDSSPLPVDKHRLIILVWEWPFGQRFDFVNCSELYSIPNCLFTSNRSWFQKADAVVMHHRDVCRDAKRLARLPRPQSQLWIWFNLESPSNSPNLGAMNNLFNLTMSYRKDSDIFSPYGMLQPLGQPQPLSIPPKTKLVAWVVSNWRADSYRVKYYQELKKHIPVDVYGRHRLPLSRDKLLPTVSQYKFYLAFENSQHEDYITEKVWKNALSSGTVPVVLGPPRENYERFLPPESFIHVDDFASAEELARYLLELSKDTERYQRYFQWRKSLKPVLAKSWGVHFCRACYFLRTTETKYKVVSNLSGWFV
ncbi:3-galactosyl-N-acetylglucosaminide 4-alpha-L-fucosyltransferase FUT3-like [Cuculus canorus]|uniref:3-galactosyl-N-acetylglucosaminide 4-alpha-L-fucosyltransferase FUT3-like n=1 Tax=Cuculus canorus TaxID=55661 RepID=UPI0023AB1E5B|nr:3-galactosyl-N-acetylglucosaminide 4-alpha-L-fucosyltransferase FUT3-like [Cuculus canorus]XP_053906408.1 3-galactosyl-N-acetylglucosaminide 4-alpha-L-fucosyltransferase FUT3-like [Cuculus canorus]XP_053906409.1 3-galactosyl-N-acetylglucosaminide 4-alpha-L-fucosyltransferase FUT3-like [Cuculus canorus]XP_053906411.1 3-galactosyl-N-acetylglucosaminide 4-alpha-L-fucosyltransferase FUT3-like [Cuculus canorus]XP_053906412.1 3-galactosyl-N-acetylglucosaminide 4-alpha-L-fucosyltransferase FUT3-lik